MILSRTYSILDAFKHIDSLNVTGSWANYTVLSSFSDLTGDFELSWYLDSFSGYGYLLGISHSDNGSLLSNYRTGIGLGQSSGGAKYFNFYWRSDRSNNIYDTVNAKANTKFTIRKQGDNTFYYVDDQLCQTKSNDWFDSSSEQSLYVEKWSNNLNCQISNIVLTSL